MKWILHWKVSYFKNFLCFYLKYSLFKHLEFLIESTFSNVWDFYKEGSSEARMYILDVLDRQIYKWNMRFFLVLLRKVGEQKTPRKLRAVYGYLKYGHSKLQFAQLLFGCSDSGQTKQFLLTEKVMNWILRWFFFFSTMIKILDQNLIFLGPIPSSPPFPQEIHKKLGWNFPEFQLHTQCCQGMSPHGKGSPWEKCPVCCL